MHGYLCFFDNWNSMFSTEIFHKFQFHTNLILPSENKKSCMPLEILRQYLYSAEYARKKTTFDWFCDLYRGS